MAPAAAVPLLQAAGWSPAPPCSITTTRFHVTSRQVLSSSEAFAVRPGEFTHMHLTYETKSALFRTPPPAFNSEARNAAPGRKDKRRVLRRRQCRWGIGRRQVEGRKLRRWAVWRWRQPPSAAAFCQSVAAAEIGLASFAKALAEVIGNCSEAYQLHGVGCRASNAVQLQVAAHPLYSLSTGYDVAEATCHAG